MAYFNLHLDNSQCKEGCKITVSHKTLIKQTSTWRTFSSTITNRVESFPGAAGKEPAKNFFLAFQIGAKKQNTVSSIGHGEVYHMPANMVPESQENSTHYVANFLEFYIDHENTTFSD